VTKAIDSLAVANELTFKCSLNCSTYNLTQCQDIVDSTQALWYSDSNLIYNNSLIYNSKDGNLYAFLNESIWTNYINTNVTSLVFVFFSVKNTVLD
jgi:hypothetical protein